MPDSFASAVPRKKFFLEMFTRDISLQDCILDLIDNSIDGLIRTHDLNLDAMQLLGFVANEPHRNGLEQIKVDYTPDRFRIRDNCGGIARGYAEAEVFNF